MKPQPVPPLVTILLDSAQVYVGAHGLPADDWMTQAGGTPAEWAFCLQSVRTGRPYVVTDALADPRYAGNPLVELAGVRSYAGVPLPVPVTASVSVPVGGEPAGRRPEGRAEGRMSAVPARMTSMNDAPSLTVLADQAAYAAAVQLAVDAAAAYYGDGTSPLDDDAYDRLVRGIEAYEAEHPEQVLPGSPTGKVAGGAVEGDVPHTVPMLSLDNVFSPDGLTRWVAGLERRLGRQVTVWSVEPKLDGLAISARYHHGRLTQLVTRGDGTAGEDVSHAIGTIVGLPGRLAEPITAEIRGEVMMTTEQFEAACEKRTAHDGTTFANPRSAAAGTLRAQDRPYVCELTFFGYGALPLPPTDGSELAERLRTLPHSQIMDLVAAWGVQTTAATPVAGIVAASVEEIQARIEAIAAARAGLPFGIDGIVIKADLADDQAAAGFGSRAPRWAIAYKLPATEKITKLIGVEWNVGRTGIIAPRAILEPVELDGSVVTYATLHNAADIARRGLMLGDSVTVYKAGDIIPRVEAPVVHLRTGDEQPISVPRVCPNCGDGIDTSQERWRCVRGRECRALASIVYAAGRDQLDIETLAESRIVQLLEAGFIADFADLFSLKREQVLGLERMGATSTDKLLAAIEVARTRPLSRVFCALGVRGTGRSMSRRIARHFATMEAILAAGAEDLQAVEGIGPEKAPVVVAELAELRPLIDKLIAAGVNMTEPGATPGGAATTAADGADGADDGTEAAELPLAGMSVVATGAMTGPLADLSRNQVNELIERAGGKASSSVSAKTALLVAGEKAGSKRTKAEDLGVKIVTPEEFAEMVAAFL
ncbi:NAD-dependent DNA ligase LigA [Planobispora siamensis]|uniref:DNA ligase n=1 Tax=Planobispora siamensis TaxID=936338 RepID=A0A8J3SIY6_9ACTN|nr:NAD-dependent DNA ligase LigA [Planobispora siamensis]GIH94154.1 DNA ligase 2 [Planobispora siamensis]